jgi:membrane-associated phospholipid phosphatase
MRTSLKPVDLLTLFFMALLTAVTLLFAVKIPSWPRFIAEYVAIGVFVLLLATVDTGSAGKRNVLSVLHAFIPIVIVLLVFNSLGDLIPLLRSRYYDDVLIRIDYGLFNTHPTLWMERFNNAVLTGFLQSAYISYYFMPISLGMFLFLAGRNREFDTMVFGVVLCFYLSYIGYLLIPAVGPRFTLDHLQTADLRAGPLTLWLRQLLDVLEQNKTDAYPSGHTAVALVSLFYAWKYRITILFRVLVPLIGALIVSTVYLRYHYVIDVIAGILLAVLTLMIAPSAQRIFSVSSGKPQG